jgi:hypothetical protein
MRRRPIKPYRLGISFSCRKKDGRLPDNRPEPDPVEFVLSQDGAANHLTRSNAGHAAIEGSAQPGTSLTSGLA